MKIDAALLSDVSATRADSSAAEASGYDGIWVSEGGHDPFLHALNAASSTERVTIGTAVAIAFARTPLTVAQLAYDMAYYSRGRFVLGLGSQVKQHVEKRFSMPWSHPAARMREFVLALRAIWASWHDGEKLDFRGDFYTHTLMTPFFSPARHDFGPPPVYLAGVGGKMTEVAGECCAGFFIHPFTTRKYFDEVTRPALERGRAAGERRPEDHFVLAGPSFVVVGRDQAELDRAARATKQQIAFYASTPGYRGVLERHGLEDLQPELGRLAREGRWNEIGDAIDDATLALFAVIGDPAAAGRQLAQRWGDVYDRISFDAPYEARPEDLLGVAAAARGALSGSR